MIPPPGSLYAFHKCFFHTFSGGLPHVPRPYERRICAFLEAVTRGEIHQGIVNLWPSSGKSSITSVSWPAWIHSFNPSARFCFVSYEMSVGQKFAASYRTLVTSDEYTRLYGEILPKQSQLDQLDNPRGGCRITTTPLAKLTSLHLDHLVLDDPQKPGESTEQEKAVFDWFRRVTPSRVIARNGARIIAQQRVSVGDLSGRLVDAYPGEWHALILPLRNPDGSLNGLDERTARALERELGRDAAAQLQQAPVPQEGGTVKAAWVRFYDLALNLDAMDQVMISADLAFTGKKTSDFSVLQVWARQGGTFYLVDQIRGRYEFPEMVRAFRHLVERYPQAHLKLVEGKASGSAVVDTLKREIPGIVTYDPRDSKEARMASVAPLFESGSVLLPNRRLAPWIDEYTTELSSFPACKNDDQCDATSQALIRLNDRQTDFAAAMNRIRPMLGNPTAGFLRGFSRL